MEGEAVLNYHAANCAQRFKSLSTLPVQDAEDWIEDRAAEFMFWTHDSNVLKTGRISLDYCLRDRSDIKDIIQGLLESLAELLKVYPNNPDNHVPLKAARREEDLLAGDGNSDSAVFEISTDKESASEDIEQNSTSTREESGFRLSETRFYIQTHLKLLTEVSFAIRKSSNKIRHWKADEYLKEHSANAEYVELRSYLTSVIVLGKYENDMLSTLLYHLHKSRLPQTVELVIRKWITDPARITPLQRRFIEANVVRRNRMLWARRVSENPSSAVQQSDDTADVPRKSPMPEGSLRAAIQEHLHQPNVSVHDPSEQSEVSLTNTELGFKSVSSKSTSAAQSKSKTAASTVTSITRTGDKFGSSEFPATMESFKCPYCLQVLSSDYKDNSMWQDHVKCNLSPYSCVHEKCSQDDEFFDTKEEWLEHLTMQHQTERWVCDECTFQDHASNELMFENEEMWKLHMSSVHTDQYSVNHLPILASFSRRRVPDLARCPLCPRPTGMSQPTQDDHIAEHVYSWAMRAVPGDHDEAGGQYASKTPGRPGYFVTLPTQEHSSWSQSDIMGPSKTLRGLLIKGQVKMTYRQEKRSQPWIPRDVIENVLGSPEGRKSLSNIPVDSRKLWKFVSKSKCLWALLVHVNRLEWLERFYNADFDDSLFPIEREGSWKLHSLKKDKYVKMPGKSADDETASEFIEDKQWQFFVPIFRPRTLAYDFEFPCRMPFVKELQTEETNFSAVTEVVIHRKHLDFPPDNQIGTVIDEAGNFHVALKEVTSARRLDRSDFEKLVENEASVLLHFGKQDHPHFIQTIARYTQGNRHFFIFPWAKGGNLRKLWRDQPSLGTASLSFSQEFCVEYIKWFFEQLLGLSGAIEKLHNPPGQPGGSCRHGDLKPENILCFCSVIPKVGDLPTGVKLVIADAGHARIHEKATDLRGEKTTTQAGTQAYTPPEVELQSDKARPRRYDIWSIGCLYLEFLIWILYGNIGLDAFHDDVKRAQPYTFYRTDPNVALKPEVQGWIEEIKKDPRCAPIMSTAVGRLIDLIETRLLVVNLGDEPKEAWQSSSDNNDPTSTTPGVPGILVRAATMQPDNPLATKRAHASEMLEEMDKIVKAARARGPRSLVWINWDGMAEAARRGIPRPSKTLSSTVQGRLEVRKGNDRASAFTLDNNWKYDVDDTTARKVVFLNPESRTKRHRSSNLCQRCQELRLLSPNCAFSDDLAGLTERSRHCDLCRLLCKSMVYLAARSQETVRFVRYESGLSLISSGNQWGPILSLCTTSESKLLRSHGIQPGFPDRLVAGGETHTKLMSEWVGDCNQAHRCRDESGFNPTRLLYIGHTDSSRIRLVTKSEGSKPVEYAALSHRWGPPHHKPPATVTFAATTWDNLSTIQHFNGIQDNSLPKTFRDAVTVTRKLGVQYIWIDSLCILQKTGKGDDKEHKEDWGRESLLMEKVFSSAYFTIAASCAQHRFDGFLKERKQRDFVTMTASDGAQFHVCEVIDDFDHDVEQGELNKRGWVLQERALSRRTIHFTETQTYWECGKGIKCETFTKTENRKAAFLGDSNFPHSVEAFKHGRQIQHYQGLYERYSSLGLSNPVDRPIAIAGLEQRLMTALKSTGGYGIFQSNFHRDLLWQRQHGRPTLERIRFGKSLQVPTWSWMAFDGEIRYMNAPLGGVTWNSKVICPFKAPNPKSSTPFETQHPIEFQAPVLSLRGVKPKLLLQDEPSRRLDEPLRCVIIGSDKADKSKPRQHYSIIVSPIRKNGVHLFYERAGVAYLTEEELGNDENQQNTEPGIIR